MEQTKVIVPSTVVVGFLAAVDAFKGNKLLAMDLASVFSFRLGALYTLQVFLRLLQNFLYYAFLML